MRSWIRGLCVGLLLSAATSASAASILIFGDSISAAYGLEIRQGWVSLLTQRLEQQAPGRHQVINASVSGETTSGGLLRLPALLAQHKPDLVVLELGANDGLRGQPPALMRKNLEAMIKLARNANAKVILLGMRIPPNYGKGYTRAFEQVFADVAKARSVPLVPFFLNGVGGVAGLMQDDGLHPNAWAQDILLENAWPPIRKALPKSKS